MTPPVGPTLEVALSFVTESNVPPSSPEIFALIFEYWRHNRYDLKMGQKLFPALKVILINTRAKKW
jgi:hypothetical protein